MNTNSASKCRPVPRNHCIALLLIFILVFLAYSNSFDCSWHLDDNINIIGNPKIKIDNLYPDTLHNVFFSNVRGSGMLFRPLTFLTFAVNWYYGQDNVFGYHLVNFFVHVLASFFLFYTILALFKTPKLKNYNSESVFFVAVLSTCLWAVNPIQTQAVTYIVQRMATMAALFYLMGLFFYIKARIAGTRLTKTVYFALTALCFPIALLCKENAALFPFAVILAEVIFFQDLREPKTRKFLFYAFVLGGLFLAVIGGLLFTEGNLFTVLDGYRNRPFSLFERVLTEARILVLYLTQIIYPVPTRLSIAHTFTISSSFFHPWTTLPSILIILGLIGVGIWQIRRRPFLSFAILFFFLNHLLESTFLPLELVFEHRNYLPSFFFFVPFAQGVYWVFSYYREKKLPMARLITGFVVLLIIGFGVGTYIRNLAWKSAKTLWEDALVKAPDSGRALHNLAVEYYEQQEDYASALVLYQKALSGYNYHISDKASFYNNMAGIHYRMGNIEKAVKLWYKGLAIYPRYRDIHFRLSFTFNKIGNFQAALRHLDLVLPQAPNNVDMLTLKGVALYKMSKFAEAHAVFRRSLQINSVKKETLIYLAASMHKMGKLSRGLWFLNYADSLYPRDPYIYLWLCALSTLNGDMKSALGNIDNLIDRLGAGNTIEYILDQYDRRDTMLPPSDSIVPIIADKVRKRGQKITQSAEEIPKM